MPSIIFTVTNDLNYDQRMQRICTSMAEAGYNVMLVGRRLQNSKPLQNKAFSQKRLFCFCSKGFTFYAEYNIRLFWWLLFKKVDIICAIDLDTILPVLFASKLRRKKRVYDAHELFTEQVEIITRPRVHKIWSAIEKYAVPKFNHGYTVNQFIADEFNRRYSVNYSVIRNLPVYSEDKTIPPNTGNGKPPLERSSRAGETGTPRLTTAFGQAKLETSNQKFILYQGAVNKGRCFEQLIPAMHQVDSTLVICGEGNFFEEVKQLIKEYDVGEKVELKGYVLPADLKQLTPKAYIAVTLFENTGLNQYYSLGNRFFDYIMAGVPQVCVDYPEYRAINDEFNVAYLISDTNVETIAAALNKILADDVIHSYLAANCAKARKYLQWQNEAVKLAQFYNLL